VNQSVNDRGFPVRHALDGDWAAAQNFSMPVSTLTRVELYLRKFGTPEFDLTVELREGSPTGTLLDTKVFTPSLVPGSGSGSVLISLILRLLQVATILSYAHLHQVV